MKNVLIGIVLLSTIIANAMENGKEVNLSKPIEFFKEITAEPGVKVWKEDNGKVTLVSDGSIPNKLDVLSASKQWVKDYYINADDIIKISLLCRLSDKLRLENKILKVQEVSILTKTGGYCAEYQSYFDKWLQSPDDKFLIALIGMEKAMDKDNLLSTLQQLTKDNNAFNLFDNIEKIKNIIVNRSIFTHACQQQAHLVTDRNLRKEAHAAIKKYNKDRKELSWPDLSKKMKEKLKILKDINAN